MGENKIKKAFNPFENGMKHWDLDYMTGTIRVIQNGSEAVIYLETNNGERIVLNICDYRE